MSELIAICFDTGAAAEAALDRAQTLQQQHLLALDDAVIVRRTDDGKVKLKQSINLVAHGAAAGSFWGALIGLIFLTRFWALRPGRRLEPSAAH